MMWSAHRLAAWVSDRSSASSEARNSATSMARRSWVQACRRAVAPPQPEPCPSPHGAGPPPGAAVAAPCPVRAGGSVRIRDRMNAWYDGNDSLGGGPLAASVTASAVSSSRRACGASTWLNDTRAG